MKHTPYGYTIKNGRAEIVEEEAKKIRAIWRNYMCGMSLTAAARAEGVPKKHSGIKSILKNKKYLGDDFYPQIMTPVMMESFEAEHLRREKADNRTGRRRKPKKEYRPAIAFTMPAVRKKYDDPIKQAEYAYSLIESEVT